MRYLLTLALTVCLFLPSAQAELEGVFNFKKDKVEEVGRASIEGTTMSPTARGIVFREKSGRLSRRYVWTLFDQDTLRKFAEDPEMKPFVEVLVQRTKEEMTMEEFKPDIPERAPKPPITVSTEPRPEVQPPAEMGMIGGFFKGSGLFLLLIMVGASGWAGWCMGEYKRYPRPVFAGIGAATPIIGPIVMVFLPVRRMRIHVPSNEEEEEDEDEEDDEDEDEEEEVEQEPIYEEPAAPVYPETEIFKRGEFNLNRRFVEHRFAKFTKPLAGADADMVMVVKSARGEFITNHILKMAEQGVSIQIDKGNGATVDETIPYTDLLEIRVKHRDAPE